jgi:hypothetical protein
MPPPASSILGAGMKEKLDSLVRSRRFWVAAAGVAVVFLKEAVGVPLSEEQITQLVLLAGSWIVGESLRSSEG